MKKAKIWYVIADGGKARFVERDEKGAFRTVVSFVSTELHAKSSDLAVTVPRASWKVLRMGARPSSHAATERGCRGGFRQARR